MGRMQDKVTIVTGGGSGLGRATAARLAAEGARVVLTDRNEGAGEAAAAEIGGGTRFMAQDVTREDDWARLLADTLSAHGRLDVLVNNAGVFGSGAPQDPELMTLEEWRLVNTVNLEGVFLGCKHAIPAMRTGGGGSIVNISSIAAMIGTPHIAAYGAGKAGVRQLTKSVALHCARRGDNIRCNSVHPGMVPTPLGQDVLEMRWGDRESGRARHEQVIPLGRLGEPDDVAFAVLFLASDESRYITGAELVVDGGHTAY